MKLKYYLRGLGVGIIVTALVIGIANGGQKESLSDAEIKQRAEQLGMVDRGNMVLADIAESSNQEQASQAEVNSSMQEAENIEDGGTQQESEGIEESSVQQESEGKEGSGTQQESEGIEESSAQELDNIEAGSAAETENTEAADSQVAEAIESSTTGQATEETQMVSAEQAENSQETVSSTENPVSSVVVNAESATITIEWGATSLAVSRLLEEAGLVADAKEFDRYLCSIGYSKYINIGTYEIPFGTSKEEIARIISVNH